MTGQSLKIAIGVHGRFYAFDLALALLARGHDVTVFTNYPARVAARFGLPPERVRSFVAHGVAARIAHALAGRLGVAPPEAVLHRMFGRWLARQVVREPWDLVHVFSGVAEETIAALSHVQVPASVERASSHIQAQDRLLREEADRTGVPVEHPSTWMVAREEREYATADAVCVLSSFAERTFVEAGFPADRLHRYTLGVSAGTFRPAPDVLAVREARVLRGDPIRVLYVGPKSARKGMADLNAVARLLAGGQFQFRAVGPDTPETQALLSDVEQRPKVPQGDLPAVYAWGDVFLFPTVEDGFAVVVTQASMSGLPVLTTENCGAADTLVEGESGWTVPARRPDLLAARLQALDADRTAFSLILRRIAAGIEPPSWGDAAREFETACLSITSRSKRAPRMAPV